jgi:hypothetical protein
VLRVLARPKEPKKLSPELRRVRLRVVRVLRARRRPRSIRRQWTYLHDESSVLVLEMRASARHGVSANRPFHCGCSRLGHSSGGRRELRNSRGRLCRGMQSRFVCDGPASRPLHGYMLNESNGVPAAIACRRRPTASTPKSTRVPSQWRVTALEGSRAGAQVREKLA